MPLCQVASRNVVVGLAAGKGDHHVVGVVVRCLELHAVQAVEDDDCKPTQSLVPIDQRMVDDDRLQESAGSGVDVGVGVAPQNAGAWTVGCGVQQAKVLDRSDTEISSEGQQILGGQVLHESTAKTFEQVGVPLTTTRGQVADARLVASARGCLADRSHRRLLLTDALGLGKGGQRPLVLRSQSQCHRHGAMVPLWYRTLMRRTGRGWGWVRLVGTGLRPYRHIPARRCARCRTSIPDSAQRLGSGSSCVRTQMAMGSPDRKVF